MAVTLLRLLPVHSAADLLYLEDTGNFMVLANGFGVKSLLVTYVGYHHLIIRLIAYFASFFDITLQPLVIMGCVVVVHALCWMLIVTALRSLDLPKSVVFVLAVLLVLQPLHQELMLNLVNSQWWTGTALIIFALGYQGRLGTCTAVTTGLLLGLQGPYSILVFPVLVLKKLWFKDTTPNGLVNSVGLAAGFQLTSMLMNPRHGAQPGASGTLLERAADRVLETAVNLWRGFIYNPADHIGAAIFAGIAMLTVYAFFRGLRGANAGSGRRERREFLLFMLMFCVYTASLFADGFGRDQIVYEGWFPGLAWNNRYLLIPHCLLLVAVTILFGRSARLFGVFAAGFLYLCVTHFSFAERFPTYFSSYANMGRFMETWAPTNPHGYFQIEMFRWNAWYYVFARETYERLPSERIRPVAASEFEFSHVDRASPVARFPEYPLTITGRTALVTLNTAVSCSETADIGLEVHLSGSVPFSIRADILGSGRAFGAFRLYEARTSGEFPVRWKDDMIQFAFPRPADHSRLTLSIAPYISGQAGIGAEPELTLRGMTVVCLPPYAGKPNR
ncbi:MAG: hypothetical protein LBR29_11000 [Methylobacteriaceae bacterium]|nr:hypothetical protein [Methylobacteriaceae bacterium]